MTDTTRTLCDLGHELALTDRKADLTSLTSDRQMMMME